MNASLGQGRTKPRGSWTFTGRDAELATIEQNLLDASGPAGTMLVGGPGVGKTRLAREALARAAAQGFAVGWVVATESARPLPLGAFLGLLSGPTAQDAMTSPASLLAFALRQLGRSGRQLILGIDDVHLLDDVSAVLIHQLVLRDSARIVVTLRAGEEIPDAISSLWRSGSIQRLDVAPLTDVATEELISRVLGGSVDRTSQRGLRRMAQGNPLFLRELVQGGLEDGWLVYDSGVWRIAAEFAMPAGLRELVARRIGAVSNETGTALDLLAIAEPLSLAAIRHLAGTEAVEDAEARGLIVVDHESPTHHTRLAHPLFGEARRSRLGSLRDRRLRGQLTLVMADPVYGHADEVLRRAVIAVDGDVDPPLELLLSGVQRAAALVDAPLAYRLAVASMKAGAGFEVQALVANFSALLPGGDPLGELDRLAAMARNDGERSRAAVMRITHLAWGVSRPDDAHAVWTQAAGELSAAPARAHLDAVGTMLLAHRGDVAQARSRALGILEDASLDGDTVMMATCGLVAASATIGSMDGVEAAVQRAIASPSAVANGVFRAPLIASFTMGLIMAGELTRAAELMSEFASGIDDTSGFIGAAATSFFGRIELAFGRAEAALRLLVEARPVIAAAGDFGGWRYLNNIALAQAAALVGTDEDMRDAGLELDEHVHPTMNFLEPDRLIAHALIVGRGGAITEALELLGQAAAVARDRGQSATEICALQHFATFGSPDALQRLEQLATVVDSPRANLSLVHSAALTNLDADALTAVSDRWQECGDTLAAATAAAQAYRFAVAQGRSNHRHLTSLQRRTATLIERAQRPRTPELIDFARPHPLTTREREIAALAGRGLSNRDIADRLHVSVRTVEGHVYRASVKLGMSRPEMGRLFRV